MRHLLILCALWAAPALADDAPDEGRIIAHPKAGLEAGAPDKAVKALLRCMVRANPDKQPINIYLPPAGNAAFEAVLKATLKWNASTFERERIAIEQRAGRICYVRKKTIEEVVQAVAADPGGVGILPSSQPLTEGLVVVWGPPQEAAPAEAPPTEGDSP